MKLKTIILSAIAVIGMATPAFAKTNKVNNTDNNVSPDTEQVAAHDLNVYGGNYTDGDKFDGLTRKVGFDRMIPPHALEVCYNKTTHIIFPSEIVYCDLGNENLVAGLADGASRKQTCRLSRKMAAITHLTSNLPRNRYCSVSR